MNKIPILWLCGPMGVGKSTVGWAIFSRLLKSGIKSGYADADQLGLCYPAPDNDPVNHRVKSRSVGAVFRNYREAGARCLVLAGSASSAEEVAMYTDEFPESALTLCMLVAEPNIIKRRFLERKWRPELVGEAMRQASEPSDFVELRVNTSALSVSEAAHRVCADAGNWPGLESS